MNKFILTSSNKQAFYDVLKGLDPTRNWVFNWHEQKSKRSLSQNDWARKFARDWGAQIGYEADEAYEILMYKCNPIYVTDKDTGEQIRLAGSFGKLNTKDAAEVQELMIRFGHSTGFYWDEGI